MYPLFNSLPLFGLCLAVFTIVELIYFSIAKKLNIIDKPNTRSSHSQPVIRGGGIIFALSFLFSVVSYESGHVMLACGVILLSAISFLDDFKEQSPRVRIPIQCISAVLLFYDVHFFDYPVWLTILAIIVVVGAINAFNFMDGINGITGTYALANLLSFGALNMVSVNFMPTEFITPTLAAVVVFLYFNFRKRARCFAGDVGSIVLAYFQIFLLLKLIVITNNFNWVLMFAVFGVDSIVTIIYRIRKKENIFKAHRSHLYQYLSNEVGLSHRLVSLLYAVAQLMINLVVILNRDIEFPLLLLIVLLPLTGVYLICRIYVQSKLKKANESL